jgi:hypothetical protein
MNNLHSSKNKSLEFNFLQPAGILKKMLGNVPMATQQRMQSVYSLITATYIKPICSAASQPAKLARMAASELTLDVAIQFKLGRRATE